jgi:hypothetical protein
VGMAQFDGIGDTHVSDLRALMPNMNLSTGIHYGVISPNSISQECLSELELDSTDTVYDDAKAEFRQRLFDVLNECMSTDECDTICDEACDRFGENYQNDYHGYEYDDGEYELHICDDNFGIYVMKSPYYTWCKGCSPCSPNAGDLDSPSDGHTFKMSWDDNGKMVQLDYPPHSIKTYCLPNDFFDDNKAPYKYFEVGKDAI